MIIFTSFFSGFPQNPNRKIGCNRMYKLGGFNVCYSKVDSGLFGEKCFSSSFSDDRGAFLAGFFYVSKDTQVGRGVAHSGKVLGFFSLRIFPFT